MRSMSRWKQVRVGHGSRGRSRPREADARQAKGDSCARSAASVCSLSVKGNALLPCFRYNCIRFFSENPSFFRKFIIYSYYLIGTAR